MKFLYAIAAFIIIGIGTFTIASAEPKVTLCHAAGLAGTTHYVTLTVGYAAAYGPAGHFDENGTPRAGHEQDYLGACTTPTSTPTARSTSTPTSVQSTSTFSPTLTPSITPTVGQTLTVTPLSSLTPTATATPNTTIVLIAPPQIVIVNPPVIIQQAPTPRPVSQPAAQQPIARPPVAPQPPRSGDGGLIGILD